MAGERADHTLQPTALANEAFLRLLDQDRVDLRSRTHFFALAATMMRRVLVDHARARRADKRGGARPVEGLDGSLAQELGVRTQDADELLALDEALAELARVQPRQARVRGRSFHGSAHGARSAVRSNGQPTGAGFILGVRPARKITP